MGMSPTVQGTLFEFLGLLLLRVKRVKINYFFEDLICLETNEILQAKGIESKVNQSAHYKYTKH